MAPYYLNAMKGGGSRKLQHHLHQIIATNSLQMYNYGTIGNINKYGFVKQPVYNYTNIEVPLYIIYAKNDKFVNAKDVENFYEKLNDKAKTLGKLLIMEEDFNANGYLFGRNAKGLVYDAILKKFKKAVINTPGSKSDGLREV